MTISKSRAQAEAGAKKSAHTPDKRLLKMCVTCTTSDQNHSSSLEQGRCLGFHTQTPPCPEGGPRAASSRPLPKPTTPRSTQPGPPSGWGGSDPGAEEAGGPAGAKRPPRAQPLPRPVAARAHLQAQGSPAATQELADVAQALALAPGLRVDLQHRAQALSAVAGSGETGDKAKRRPRPALPTQRATLASRPRRPGASPQPQTPTRSAAASPHPFFFLRGCTNLCPFPHQEVSPGAGSDVLRPRPRRPARDVFRLALGLRPSGRSPPGLPG